MSQVALECAKYLQLSDSGWHKSEILTHNAAKVFRVFLKTLSPTFPLSCAAAQLAENPRAVLSFWRALHKY